MVWLSETLVHGAEGVIISVGISEFFLGIILVPLIGNVAEHLVAVQMALKNKMDLSTEIAISSSLQIALFVAPLLVFISLLLGHPMQLIFNPVRAAGAAGLGGRSPCWSPTTANPPGWRAPRCWRSTSSWAWPSSCCHESLAPARSLLNVWTVAWARCWSRAACCSSR